VDRKDRWDSLIRYWVEKIWPDVDWRLIKAQAMVESNMDPKAVSPAGARGLLQLMPRTDLEIDGELDGTDVEGNLKDGITYLREQYLHFPEIPDEIERFWFALAAYNGGRGYVNKAIGLAYEQEFGEPTPHSLERARRGRWQRWDFTEGFLKSDLCRINGKKPDHRQILDYVEKVSMMWQELTGGPTCA
jgi:hypothetical protein